MQKVLLSPLNMEDLKAELSSAIVDQLTPILSQVNKPSPKIELLTRKEAAKLLGVSLPTLLDWTKTGKVQGYRIATRIRYKRTELENSLSQIRTK